MTMTGVIGLLGWTVAGNRGIIFALLSILIVVLFSPHVPPQLLLRALKARRFSALDFPQLFNAAALIAERADLDFVPELYYIPSDEMNAFAVGDSKNVAICLTGGLIQRLTGRELVAILAHEAAHIRNKDLMVMRLAVIAGRITEALSFFGKILFIISLPAFIGGDVVFLAPLFIIIFAPTVSIFLQLALSRTREFEADRLSTQLTGDPAALITALQKIETYQQGFWRNLLLPRWYYHQSPLLRSHPATSERIALLRALEQQPARYPPSA